MVLPAMVLLGERIEVPPLTKIPLLLLLLMMLMMMMVLPVTVLEERVEVELLPMEIP